jgi:3,4-dihydroxy-2-butanone 4-phosphate synthase
LSSFRTTQIRGGAQPTEGRCAATSTPRDRAPVKCGSAAARRALSIGTVVLVQDASTAVTFAVASAGRIDTFTLERLESLAGQPARLVLGSQLARHWQLRDRQSVDATRGIDAGLTVADRARTMRVAASLAPRSELTSPGHVVIETPADAAAALGLELARRQGGNAAIAIAAISDDEGRSVPAQALREDLSLSHLAFTIADSNRSPGPAGRNDAHRSP